MNYAPLFDKLSLLCLPMSKQWSLPILIRNNIYNILMLMK